MVGLGHGMLPTFSLSPRHAPEECPVLQKNENAALCLFSSLVFSSSLDLLNALRAIPT